MDSDDDISISQNMSASQDLQDSDDQPIMQRSQRRASVASREGIRRGVRSDSSDESDDAADMESSLSGSESSHVGRKRGRKPAKASPKRALPKKAISKQAKAKAKASPKAKPSPKAKAKPVVESEDDESSDDENTEQRVMRVVNRTPKEQLVADLLCRWWYVLPEWPPVEFDYSSKLQEARLRLVPLERWETEADVDSDGFMKCYALSQYKGLFRDAQGRLNDLRPIQGKPCYSEFMKRTDKELSSLVSAALSKQLELLANSPDASLHIAELKEKLKAIKKYFYFLCQYQRKRNLF